MFARSARAAAAAAAAAATRRSTATTSRSLVSLSSPPAVPGYDQGGPGGLLKGRHLLTLQDFTGEEIKAMIDTAHELKRRIKTVRWFVSTSDNLPNLRLDWRAQPHPHPHLTQTPSPAMRFRKDK